MTIINCEANGCESYEDGICNRPTIDVWFCFSDLPMCQNYNEPDEDEAEIVNP